MPPQCPLAVSFVTSCRGAVPFIGRTYTYTRARDRATQTVEFAAAIDHARPAGKPLHAPCAPTTINVTYTLSAPRTTELEIRKSRFIAFAIPVEDRDAAMHALQHLRDEHPAATHVCWALLAGGQSGMSDDGEPSGTAGRPILEVLRHHDLDGVLGAVVRYYGGVKLGAGGLVRAYTDAIASALLDAERVERIRHTRFAIEIGYPDEARVRRWIEQSGYELTDSSYGMTVKLVVKLPEAVEAAAKTELFDLTQGRAGFPDL